MNTLTITLMGIIIAGIIVAGLIFFACRQNWTIEQQNCTIKDLTCTIDTWDAVAGSCLPDYQIEMSHQGTCTVVRKFIDPSRRGYKVYRVVIKHFRDTDKEFNRRQAEELIEKLNEE